MSRIDLEQARGAVEIRTRRRFVPVECVCASDMIYVPYLARRNWSLTGGEQDKGRSGVDNTGRGREDSSRTVLNGLVDTPVLAGRVSRRRRAVQFRVRMEILELELVTTRAYMYVIDPVNLVESVPPNVNSPFWSDDEVVGSKDTETRSNEIAP